MLVDFSSLGIPMGVILFGMRGGRIKFRFMLTRSTEKIHKFIAEGPTRGMVEGKIIHIQAETTVVAHFDEFVDVVDPCWLPIGCHSHHLILPFIDLETQEGSERRIKQAKGMWK